MQGGAQLLPISPWQAPTWHPSPSCALATLMGPLKSVSISISKAPQPAVGIYRHSARCHVPLAQVGIQHSQCMLQTAGRAVIISFSLLNFCIASAQVLKSCCLVLLLLFLVCFAELGGKEIFKTQTLNLTYFMPFLL